MIDMVMGLSSNELRIYYGSKAFTSSEAQSQWEKDFDALCAHYHLQRWASGQDMVSGIRDIAYDQQGDVLDAASRPES